MTTITTPSSIALVPSLKTGGKVKTSAPLCAALIELAMEFRSMAEHMAASRVASRAPT